MEPNRGGKRKGANGGRSAVAQWRSALGVKEPSQRTERPTVDREHKSKKRLCQNNENSGSLTKWADLSPLCQQAFRDEVAAPVYGRGPEPVVSITTWKDFDGRLMILCSLSTVGRSVRWLGCFTPSALRICATALRPPFAPSRWPPRSGSTS